MGSFLAPILVIILINTIIFIWVVVVVRRHAKEKAARMNKAINKQQILRMMISISGVLFLFGLTWLFFILTISVPGLRETFQILFTVFNSLQGFFVFAFILFTEGFGYWKETLLSCYKSKLKPTQTSLQFFWKNKMADASTLSDIPHNISTTDHIHSEMNTKQPIQEFKVLESFHDQALMDMDVLY
jgi:heme/copper-type cytochrome/quinol oxidase subunit 2